MTRLYAADTQAGVVVSSTSNNVIHDPDFEDEEGWHAVDETTALVVDGRGESGDDGARRRKSRVENEI